MNRRFLLLSLAAAALACPTASPSHAVELDPAVVTVRTPHQLKWRDPANKGPANGISLLGDGVTGHYVNITKWNKGNNFSRPHFHANDRLIYILSGTWWNGTGTAFGPDREFTTPNVPLIESSEASVGTNSAHLAVSVVSNARPTQVRIEYGGAAYGATKASLEAMTRAWAAEYSASGVRVNAIAPGPVYTPTPSGPEFITALGETTPMRRASQPEEIAEVVVFLASPRASYITGVSLNLDGGRLKSLW